MADFRNSFPGYANHPVFVFTGVPLCQPVAFRSHSGGNGSFHPAKPDDTHTNSAIGWELPCEYRRSSTWPTGKIIVRVPNGGLVQFREQSMADPAPRLELATFLLAACSIYPGRCKSRTTQDSRLAPSGCLEDRTGTCRGINCCIVAYRRRHACAWSNVWE